MSAALHLAERGLKPLILEADASYVGGRLAGAGEVDVNGWKFRLEHGVHGIWSPYRNLQAMLARHNLRPVLVPAQKEEEKRNGLVKRSGRFLVRVFIDHPGSALHFAPKIFIADGTLRQKIHVTVK
jgi:uncharacterized protein with NAD-binding domain and iron-sulfur cluster